MRPLGRKGNYISARIGRAIADYNLIEDKDRILVGVSGGKDSLTLLHLLNERKKWAPVKYDLIAMHVETDLDCKRGENSARLRKFFKKEGVKYRFKKIKISDSQRGTDCFWCSWNKRKALFLAADKDGCNKVALGHNKDDMIETLMLNILFQGQFSGMNPRQELFKGKITIVRPLCYVDEGVIAKYAKEMKFTIDRSKCSRSDLSKRKLVKDFIARVQRDCPPVKTNIFRSMSRINREYLQIV